MSVIDRSRLTDRLTATNGQRLTLVSAPAGFGKTTLQTEWIPHSAHCVARLSLDDNDTDPERFWAYVIAALQVLHAALGASAMASLEAPRSPPSKRLGGVARWACACYLNSSNYLAFAGQRLPRRRCPRID